MSWVSFDPKVLIFDLCVVVKVEPTLMFLRPTNGLVVEDMSFIKGMSLRMIWWVVFGLWSNGEQDGGCQCYVLGEESSFIVTLVHELTTQGC